MNKLCLLPLLLLPLAACVETPLPSYESEVNYQGMHTISFDASEKTLINDSVLSEEAKLQQAYGVSVEGEVRKWLEHRIKTGGSQGSFYVILKSVDIGSAALPTTGGMQGYFKREQASKLIGSIEVLFSVEGSAQQLPPAEASVKVSATETLPEEASAFEREKAYKSLVNRLVSGMNREAEKQFNSYFKGYQL